MQVAIILETAMAISILVASSMLLSGLFYANSVGNRSQVSQSDATYDLFIALLKNETYGRCLAAGNSTCMNGLLSSFASAYGLHYASLSYSGSEFSSGSSSACAYESRFCLPVARGAGFDIACLTLCG